jgi:hypothetical protein
MKMKLFYLSLDCGSDRHIVQVVAPDAGMAVEFFRENLNDLGSEMGEPSILRIDQTLTGDERLGLDAMLETAPVGFASFAEGVGWIVHVAPVSRLNLYRIESADGEEAHVIAPNRDVAAAIWFGHLKRPDGEPVLYRIWEGMDELEEERRRGILPLLEFGSVGIAQWHDGSWSMK